MKYLICLIVFAIGISPLQSADYATAREYVLSKLKSLKEAEPPEDSWLKSTLDKLGNLKTALPASDTAFGTTIQKGINALNEIQNQENDTLLLDLFGLGSAFANYYRSHKDTPAFTQNQALVSAFKAFEFGESRNPLAYFNSVLHGMIFTYRHFYSAFAEPIPGRILDCQVEYLGSAYDRKEPDEPDNEIVYAVVANWSAAFARLKVMPLEARNAALSTLEQALDSGEIGDAQTEMYALQHLAEARAFFVSAP